MVVVAVMCGGGVCGGGVCDGANVRDCGAGVWWCCVVVLCGGGGVCK